MKMLWLALLATLCAGATLDTAESELAAGRYRDAVAALDSIQADARGAGWHLLKSKALDGLNDPARAVAEAQQSIQLDPRNESAWLQLATIFLSRNTPDAAYDILSQARPAFPDSVLIRLGLGLALNGMRRYEDAIRNLQECLRMKPGLGPAFDALGSAYLNMGDYEDLLREAASYSRANPRDFRGPYYEAAAREELALDPKAVETLAERSIALNPNFAAAHALAGRVLLDEGMPERAVTELREAIRLRPGYSPAHLYLSRALRKLGRNAEAEAEARELARLNEEQNVQPSRLLYHRGNLPAPSPAAAAANSGQK